MIYDVLIVGGGVAGLMSAYKFLDMGLSVALVENKPALASGPSTRNEGWLHRGTYHATSIKDRGTAVQIAQRCIYGHEQLLRFCPEAIEERDTKPIAMLKDESRVDEIVSRWKEAAVMYWPLTKAEAARRCISADFNRAAALFEVKDVSINTRLLYRKLVARSRQMGGVFHLGCTIYAVEGNTLLCTSQNQARIRLTGRKIVYTAGGGARALFREHHGIELPIRYWKSHLVVTRRLSTMGIFYLDPSEAAIMHHGDVSVIGFNDDALLCPEADYEVSPDRAQNLRNGISRIFPGWRGNNSYDVACVKVDYTGRIPSDRSLNIAICEPVRDHVVALPGKLTETPFLTDELALYIHNEIEDVSISRRPCDEMQLHTAAQ
jgi:glycine/D-amino acid oxidase-like deaminating enzyme